MCHLHWNGGWESFVQSSSYGSVLKTMSLFCICVCILCSAIFNPAPNIWLVLPDCGLICTLILFSLVPSSLKCWLHGFVDSLMISGLGFLPPVVSYLMNCWWSDRSHFQHGLHLKIRKEKRWGPILGLFPKPLKYTYFATRFYAYSRKYQLLDKRTRTATH